MTTVTRRYDAAGMAGAAQPLPNVPATAWAVLGLLSFGRELSGYDLKKWADTSLSLFYWAPSVSQIYGALKRLESLGYVSARTVPQDELRDKTVYVITHAGREALAGWAGGSVEPPVLKHGVLMRVWLGHLSRPDRLREIVQEHVAYARDMAERSAASLDRAEHDADAFAFPAAVMRWSQRYYENELALAEQLVIELDELNEQR